MQYIVFFINYVFKRFFYDPTHTRQCNNTCALVLGDAKLAPDLAWLLWLLKVHLLMPENLLTDSKICFTDGAETEKNL